MVVCLTVCCLLEMDYSLEVCLRAGVVRQESSQVQVEQVVVPVHPVAQYMDLWQVSEVTKHRISVPHNP